MTWANYNKYGNNEVSTRHYFGSDIEWSDITGQIDAGRPFVYYNWDTSSYPNWEALYHRGGYDSASFTCITNYPRHRLCHQRLAVSVTMRTWP